ncbi:MAG: hypothetical protein NWT02_12900 [Opitutales bacterium]|jgi:hypothetical protein|nr:hypothetical protein [Opitutales bacterium]MDP4644406.1 hypothetical protein [Opitutales bacterium]MDP4777872.1 hypothetical protein [Opitutales bacterium]MDP5079839.1 hypothetical protein [Opitutales bacterium]
MSLLRHPILHLILLTYASLTSANANVIFSEDFESEPVIGATPSKASAFRPKVNELGQVVIVVGQKHNIAGSANAVYMQDKSQESICLEYDFVDSSDSQISALRIDFSFAQSGINETKSDKLYFGAGAYSGENSSRMNANSNRYLQLEFIDTNELKINTESGKDKTIKIAQIAKNTISVIVNDYDNKQIEYISPADGKKAVLAANMAAYYLNDVLVHETNLDLDNETSSGTVGTSENNFGRMGFYSSTKSDNNGWMFDDFKVSKL